MRNTIALVGRIALMLAILLPTVAYAQFDIPDLSNITDLDLEEELEDILEDIIIEAVGVDEEPALTTSLDDAVTDIPFLDGYNPTDFRSMRRLERAPNGGFVRRPGRWRMDVQSYCLHAGTHGPGSGDGYIYAPLLGPRADVITHIITNSVFHPEIPQRDIQCLIWGILAKTKTNDMSSDLQHAASLLLTQGEIRDLNGGALGLVPDEMWDEVFDSLDVSPEARRILEAEAGIRSALSGGSWTYSQIERMAVLEGEASPQEGDRYIPEGRWSYHPLGYFIRYFPHGYPTTTVEMSIPDCFHIEWDQLGRITAIDDGKLRRLALTYDDEIDSLTIPGSRLAGYAFKQVRFTSGNPSDPDEQEIDEWEDRGWTLAGYPAPTGVPRVSASGRFSDARQRAEWATDHIAEVRRVFGDNAGWSVVARLGFVADAVQQAGADSSAVEFCKEAWQAYFVLFMHGPHQDGASQGTVIGKYHGKGGSNGASGDGAGPGGGSANPGNRGAQRLGPSNRPAGENGAGDGDEGAGEGEGEGGGEGEGEGEGEQGGKAPSPEDIARFDWTSGSMRGFYDGWAYQGSGGVEGGHPPAVPSGKSPAYYVGYSQGFSEGVAQAKEQGF